MIVSARELNLNGLRGDQRNWNNDHTVYTHGYGVVAAYADRRRSTGQPVWAEKNLPARGQSRPVPPADLLRGARAGLLDRRSPARHATRRAEHPADRRDQQGPELDVRGTGGVGIGSTFRRVLYAAKFWDSSILLSQRVNSDSRLIYNRNPLTMVKKIAPWLTIDGDPYPGGRRRPAGLDHGRLHHVVRLPDVRPDRPEPGDQRLAHPGECRCGPAVGPDQLHPQLGEDHRRRVLRAR